MKFFASILLILGISSAANAQSWGNFTRSDLAALDMALNTFPGIDEVYGTHDFANRDIVFDPFSNTESYASAYQDFWNVRPSATALHTFENTSLFTESYLRALEASKGFSPANLFDTTKIPYNHRTFPSADPFSSYSSI